MNIQEYQNELVKQGYKLFSDNETTYTRHIRYKKRNKEIILQVYDDYYNVYCTIERKGLSIEINQHNVTSFYEALSKINMIQRRLAGGKA